MAVTSSIKSQPIFQIHLSLEREGNLQQNICVISRHTLSVLPHYLWELKSSNLL